jgi:hypothetical protein
MELAITDEDLFESRKYKIGLKYFTKEDYNIPLYPLELENHNMWIYKFNSKFFYCIFCKELLAFSAVTATKCLKGTRTDYIFNDTN